MLTIFIAGILSVLSPCILPIIPVLMVNSLVATRKSLFVFVLGFILSYIIVGALLTELTAQLSFNPEALRYLGASLMILMSLAMLFTFLQGPLEGTARFIDSWLKKIGRGKLESSSFFVGATLALIWAPCVGPALGVALGWLTVSGNIGQGILFVSIFAIGVAVALLSIGFLSKKLGHSAMQKIKSKLRFVYKLSAVIYLIVGISVFTGLDKRVEACLTANLPEWWAQILVSF